MLGTSTNEAKRMLTVLGNSLVEIRALPVSNSAPLRGYFEDLDQAGEIAVRMGESNEWGGIYVTINQLSDGLRSLADGQMARGKATADTDIDRFRHLVLDIDPIKPNGVKGAATDAEHNATLEAANKAKEIAAEHDWPEPMIVDSGNGSYAILRVDLPNDVESKELLGRVLQAFAAKIDDDGAKVDTSVNNASRIFRVAGTLNRKGEHSEDRPHRMAKIISAPSDDTLIQVSLDQLQELGGKGTTSRLETDCKLQLSERLHAELANVVIAYLRRAEKAPPFEISEDREFVKLEFAYCPFKGGSHTDGRSAVLVWRDGTVGFKCFHDKCNGLGWKSLQKELEVEFCEAVAERIAAAGVTGQTTRRFDDPVLLAQTHMDKWRWENGDPTTVFFNGDLWRFDSRDAWQKTKATELSPWLRDTIQIQFDNHAKLVTRISGKKTKPQPVRGAIISDSYKAIESLSRRAVSVSTQPPFWLNQHEEWAPSDLLVFRNGILNVRRHLKAKECFIPVTPRLFYDYQAPFDFDPQAPEPVAWQWFLDSLEQDDDWLGLLQEIMGYCIWGAYDLQKYFVMFGPPRSGKGTIANVLTDLVGGASAVCSPSLQDFAESFGLEQTIGKRLAIVPEIDAAGKKARQIVAQIKAITGGDMITVNRKHIKNIPLRLPLKILMLTNHFVALPDNSGALQARLLPLRLTKSFVGKEDIKLAEKLANENASILNWALKGARRLWQANGEFTIPQSSQGFLDEHFAASAPLRQFIEDCCEVDLRKTVQSPALYEIYTEWYKATHPDESPISEESFAIELRTAIPSVEKKRMSKVNQREYNGHAIFETDFNSKNRRTPIWVGVCPKPEWTKRSVSRAISSLAS